MSQRIKTMSELEKLIAFINDFGDDDKDDDKDWIYGRWGRELTSSVPGWRAIVKNPSSWEELDIVRPKGKHYDNLCEELLNAAGFDLAKRWFDSNVSDQKRAAVNWLEENIEFWDDFSDEMKLKVIDSSEFFDKFTAKIWGTLTASMKDVLIRKRSKEFLQFLNVSYWNELTDDLKTEFLKNIFKEYEGEPLKTINEYVSSIYHLAHGLEYLEKLPLPQLEYLKELPLPRIAGIAGYIPAPEVEKVLFIIQDANDIKYLDRINEMISQRKKAYQKISFTEIYTHQLIPYSPSRNERELIARLMEKTIKSGYLPTALPSIYVSSEPPPIFIAYPELEEGEEDDYRNKRDEYRIPRNRERIRLETISIEELLGVYQPQYQKIVIYERGIKWIRNRFNEEWLFAVVLIHEIGHWITHQLPKPGSATWSTDLYILGETDVHEGWAQLMTWWIADEIGGIFKSTFEKLNKNQSSPYRVFEKFKNEPIDKVMASLEKLRQLSWPARLQDWEKAI